MKEYICVLDHGINQVYVLSVGTPEQGYGHCWYLRRTYGIDQAIEEAVKFTSKTRAKAVLMEWGDGEGHTSVDIVENNTLKLAWQPEIFEDNLPYHLAVLEDDEPDMGHGGSKPENPVVGRVLNFAR